MNIQLFLIVITMLSSSLHLSQTFAATEQIKKTSRIRSTTPAPSRFVVKDGKIFDLQNKKPVFFKGIGYSPYLPGETPLQGASPGDDGRYREHLTKVRDLKANYLHVFPVKMPAGFFTQLDDTDLVYSQDIWMFPHTQDFLAEDYLAWKWSLIKEAIDHTYRTGRPDRLVFFSIGDELLAESIARTDARHPKVRKFSGKHIVVSNRTPTEIALARLMDKAIDYELTTYGRRHLYCHTSWTHIGPLDRTDIEVPSASALLPDIGDLVCLNIYTYARGVVTSPPGSITGSKYQGYLEQLAASTNKPIFVTQVGLSTSAFEPDPSAPGFGGHKVKDVPHAFKAIWKDLRTAKGSEKFCGISFFELHDEWWKSGEDPTDSTRHEPQDPEEWFGLFEVDTDHHLLPKGSIPKTIREIYGSSVK
jgi:hypothetical protein